MWVPPPPRLLGVASFRGAGCCSWVWAQEAKDIGLPRPGSPGGPGHPQHIPWPAPDLPTPPHTPSIPLWKSQIRVHTRPACGGASLLGEKATKVARAASALWPLRVFSTHGWGHHVCP